MPVDPESAITITAYDWVLDFAEGQARDLRVRWALEETVQNYAVRFLSQGQQKEAAHRALQPFGQVPTYEEGDLTLFESGAIVWHIAERFPGLRPAFQRALSDQLAGFTGSAPPGFDEWMAELRAKQGELA